MKSNEQVVGHSPRRLKIAVVSDYDFPTGGIEVFVQQFLRETSNYLESTLLTWSHTAPNSEGVRRVAVAHGDIRVIWETLSAAHVVMIHTSFNVRALAWLVGDYLQSVSTPVVTIVHTSQHSDPGFAGASEQLARLESLMRRSQVVVAVSQDVADSLADLLKDAPSPVVIENAARRFPMAGLGGARPRGRRRVSFIGRPHPQKGFDHFRRLAHELHPLGFEFAANTVSIPVHFDDPIEYTSNLPDDDLRDFFDRTDLLVAPYLRADGMPLALLEALGCGVPVLGYDSPGVGDLLRRHQQLVLRPRYADLRDAVRAWGAGLIDVPNPEPAKVPAWRASAEAYVEVLCSAAAGSARRGGG